MTGVEASALFQPQPSWTLMTTLRYNEGRFETGDNLPMISPLKNVTSVKKTFENGWISAEAEFAAPQNKVSKPFGEQVTGSYKLFHLRAGYQLTAWKKTIDLNGGLENILNEVYREHLDWGNIPRPGRNCYIQVAVSF